MTEGHIALIVIGIVGMADSAWGMSPLDPSRSGKSGGCGSG